jgi:hypothetical protein
MTSESHRGGHLSPDEPCAFDGYRWLTLDGDTVDQYRRQHSDRPYTILTEVTLTLKGHPLPRTAVVDAFAVLPELTLLAEQVTACILGVPDPSLPRRPASTGHRATAADRETRFRTGPAS